MTSDFEKLVTRFLRNYTELFSARDMSRVFTHLGLKISPGQAKDILESSPLVFCLENDLYVTRAGAFTGEVFSICPTVKEFEQGVIVLGDRCMPFADSELLSSSLSFYINGKRLLKKAGTFDSDFAIDAFILYGEEYAPQYIASDPANKDLDMVDRDFELPNTVKLTGIDMRPLVENYGFKKGDRLLCCVSNWDKGRINTIVLHGSSNGFDQGEAGEKRLLWYAALEKCLLESFEKRGPLSTMEEQISDVFFEHRKELCVENCGSVEEYITRYAKKVGVECFGVETRLWYKNQEVPAVGKWNEDELDYIGEDMVFFKHNINDMFSVPDFICDQFVLDMFYTRSDSLEALVDRVVGEEYGVDESVKKRILLQLKHRHDILLQGYNWFADQIIGKVRHEAVALYEKVSLLVFKIDLEGDRLNLFPQQELIILSQLYSHLMHILESLEDDETESDSEALLLSLEGMCWNYEDIRGSLESALKTEEINRFKVIKKN